MPTYVCTTRVDALGDDERAAIAAAVAQAHREATGAPAFLVQVMFREAPRGSRFLGGRVADDYVFVRGDIRAGRSAEARERLTHAIVKSIASIMHLRDDDIWVYLNALQATDMVEYGRTLPPPGEEQAWFDALPAEVQARLAARPRDPSGTGEA